MKKNIEGRGSEPTRSTVARARQREGLEMGDEEDPKRDEGAKVDLRGLAEKTGRTHKQLNTHWRE